MKVGTLVKYLGSACWSEDFGVVVSIGCTGMYSIYWLADGEVCHYSKEEVNQILENTVEVLCK